MAFSEAPLKFNEKGQIIIERPINWNYMEDPLDEAVWDKLTSQFWLPEKVPLSNDLPSWNNKMTPEEKDVLMKIFATLTGLDSLQGEVGAIQMIPDATTQHEVAVLANIAFMEAFVGDTELLTQDGWKKISEIVESDKVMQYHGESGKMNLATPRVLEPMNVEETYKIVHESFTQHVSPKHRVMVEELINGQWITETYYARELYKNRDKLRNVRFVTYNNDEIGYVNLEEVSITVEEGGTVYCVQVPTTFLLTRNNGVVVSGNCVHAKSYSSINATFISSEEIEKYWRWYSEDENVQYKMKRITEFYYGKNAIMRKAASVILEGFLFYSGFYYPLFLSSNGKMTNTCDIIRLIIRDEACHQYYLSMLFQKALGKVSEEEKEEIIDQVYELIQDLYDNEVEFTEKIYEPIGLAEDVKQFLHYNANRSLMSLGLDPLFPVEETNFSTAVRTALALDSETHDFFSGSGSSYIVAKTEELTEDDWEF